MPKGVPINEVDRHLGERIRDRREFLGLTQKSLAAKVGASFQQVQKWEAAKNRISASRLWRVAEALEIPPSYFYAGLPSEVFPSQ